jgi:hypothetical protein
MTLKVDHGIHLRVLCDGWMIKPRGSSPLPTQLEAEGFLLLFVSLFFSSHMLCGFFMTLLCVISWPNVFVSD